MSCINRPADLQSKRQNLNTLLVAGNKLACRSNMIGSGANHAVRPLQQTTWALPDRSSPYKQEFLCAPNVSVNAREQASNGNDTDLAKVAHEKHCFRGEFGFWRVAAVIAHFDVFANNSTCGQNCACRT